MSDESLEQENKVLRQQIDRLSVMYDERIDEMTRIFAGYIMEKCHRKTLVVDPVELKERFQPDRVELSAANGGKIRYRLLPGINND